jgi:DNA-binding transcriptional ArsR family regulator
VTLILLTTVIDNVIIIDNDNIINIEKRGIMAKGEADLILHPQRYRILQTLLGRQMSTQQIADHMPDIPQSSIYRHLKTLLEAGLVQVAETNRIKGIEEKTYTVGEIPTIRGDELSHYTRAEHQRFFGAYLSYLLKGFSEFIQAVEVVDLQAERAGFSENVFYATTQELDELLEKIKSALQPLHENGKKPERQRQMFSVITFPIERKEK